MRSRWWRGCTILVAVLPGIAGPLAAQQRIPGAPRRVWLDARWDSIGAVQRDAADTILVNVQNVAVADSVAVFVDFADKSVSAVSPDGRLRWRYAKTGSGPAEIGAPAAVSIAANGDVWLADRSNARGYRFSRTGQIVETVSFPFMPERVVAISATEVAVMPSIGDGMQVVTRAAQGKSATVRLPSDPLASAAHVMPRSMVGLAGLDGGRLAVTYAVASLTLIHDGRQAPIRLLGPEGQAFPGTIDRPVGGGYARIDLEPEYVEVGWGVFAIGDTIFVATSARGSAGQKARRLPALDLYSISQRRYLGTVKLPREHAEGFACSRIICALLAREPEPSLSFWRRRMSK